MHLTFAPEQPLMEMYIDTVPSTRRTGCHILDRKQHFLSCCLLALLLPLWHSQLMSRGTASCSTRLPLLIIGAGQIDNGHKQRFSPSLF